MILIKVTEILHTKIIERLQIYKMLWKNYTKEAKYFLFQPMKYENRGRCK